MEVNEKTSGETSIQGSFGTSRLPAQAANMLMVVRLGAIVGLV